MFPPRPLEREDLDLLLGFDVVAFEHLFGHAVSGVDDDFVRVVLMGDFLRGFDGVPFVLLLRERSAILRFDFPFTAHWDDVNFFGRLLHELFFFVGSFLRLVLAVSRSCFSLMDSYICFEAPLRLDFFFSPRLADRAAPAAICCFLDFAGILAVRVARNGRLSASASPRRPRA
jgi:hypothetical protein